MGNTILPPNGAFKGLAPSKLHEPPEGCVRWTPGRKAWVAVEVVVGNMTIDQAVERWGLNPEEVGRWVEKWRVGGLRGLYETRKPRAVAIPDPHAGSQAIAALYPRAMNDEELRELSAQDCTIPAFTGLADQRTDGAPVYLWDNEASSAWPGVLTVAAGSGAILRGDLITFAGREAWWKRLLVWLRLRKRPAAKVFTVIDAPPV